MVNTVSGAGGYQSYAYQQQTNPVQEQPRGGENRVEKREAPAPDTQRSDQRAFESRDEDVRANDNETAAQERRETRGQNLDVVV